MKSPSKDPADSISRDFISKNSYLTPWTLPKTVIIFIIVISLPYVFYSLRLLYLSNPPSQQTLTHDIRQSQSHPRFQNNFLPTYVSSTHNPQTAPERTSLKHIVFGIGASSSTWDRRKNYLKLWWRPKQMRGHVWLNKPVKYNADDYNSLPPIKISSDTSKFDYKHPWGTRDAIRMSRIVSESLRLGMKDVRWFVMGDDDTVFIADNLVRVLSKYDHNQFYYIGSPSETHVQNLNFYYGMAFGGGGFAISYPLAKALEKTQDRCLLKYSSLYGSDARIHACLSELGVPLTREQGFHQFDLHGNIYGYLAAHPIAPVVSLHHLDLIEPIFPDMDRVQAVQRLMTSMKLDSAALIQQSFCYDKTRTWTVSVSWGYAVQIIRGMVPASEIETPTKTFMDWNSRGDDGAFAFNVRPLSITPCETPFVYFLSNALYNASTNQTATEYIRYRVPLPVCNWKIPDPSRIHRVEVYKKPDPNLWDKSPRRNCCRILRTKKKRTLVVDVGVCRADESVDNG
ncbi:hypothetical protein Patl1_00490 [Pistacia atlantica]|uniref:Uncharacterized protein n=1 Tax=Pistacia atlantica TaxID=434234 RepID=A0ACC1C7N1_9ROSI|nr:hypothetical protein Patl1_00490 [Pistacia atlantica]